MPLPTAAADDPLSWRVLLSLAARLERVRVANGYLTDLGADVRVDGGQIDLRGVTQPVTLIAATDFARAEGGSAKLARTDMQVAAVVFVPGDSADHMRQAHRVRTDLLRAFADTSTDLPALPRGGTVTLTITDTVIEPRPDGANCIAVQINAQAGLVDIVSAP